MSTGHDVDAHSLPDGFGKSLCKIKKHEDDVILCQSISRALTARECLLHTNTLVIVFMPQ
jgi:hypothetical protein